MNDILIYFSLKYNGEFDRIFGALTNKEEVDQDLKKELFEQQKSKCISILSDEYPEALKGIDYPPFTLSLVGDTSLLHTPAFGLIGCKNASDYGIEVTQKVCSYLASQDIPIVIGLATEIDLVAAREYLDQGKKIIAVLPGGADYTNLATKDIYQKIAKTGLIVSEYPDGMKPRRDTFIKRDRILAGLSNKIVITEAARKGEPLVTTGFALEQGKDVVCVPTRFGEKNDGCNLLISMGAKSILDLEDLVQERDFASLSTINMDINRKKNQNIDL